MEAWRERGRDSHAVEGAGERRGSEISKTDESLSSLYRYNKPHLSFPLSGCILTSRRVQQEGKDSEVTAPGWEGGGEGAPKTLK